MPLSIIFLLGFRTVPSVILIVFHLISLKINASINVPRFNDQTIKVSFLLSTQVKNKQNLRLSFYNPMQNVKLFGYLKVHVSDPIILSPQKSWNISFCFFFHLKVVYHELFVNGMWLCCCINVIYWVPLIVITIQFFSHSWRITDGCDMWSRNCLLF